MTETYTGIVDRIEDDETAVILLEEDNQVVDEKTVAVDRFPAPAQTSGSALTISLEDGNVVSIAYQPNTTHERRESVRAKLDRLSSRLSDREE